jgi:predicted secreted protein
MAMTTTILDGNLLGVYNGTYLIALATSCSLSLNTDMRDISNKDSAGWGAFLPGQKKWTITVDCLVNYSTNYNWAYLFGLWFNSTALTLKWQTTNAADYYYTGTAYITSIQKNAPMNGNVSFSVTFQGTGAITQTIPGE